MKRLRFWKHTTNLHDKLCYWLIHVLGLVSQYLYRRLHIPVWKKGDGRVLRIDQMSDEHLFNAMRVCVRRKERDTSLVFHLAQEAERRRHFQKGEWPK